MKQTASVSPLKTNWSQTWKWILTLVLGAMVLYWAAGALSSDFIQLDDDFYVLLNPNVSRGLTSSGISWAFTTVDYFYWQPLTWISHMLDCEMYGLNPSGHHFTNILIHGINAGLVFLVLVRLTGMQWASLLGAAIFAFHPLRVESVAWIAERKDLLSSMFWLCALLAHERYARTASRLHYWLTVLSMALGAASKPTVVTLPFALLLLDYWPLRRTQPFLALLKEKVPLFVLAVVCAVLTFQGQQEFGAVAALEALPLSFRLGNAAASYARYLGKMVWPQPLAVYYPFESSLNMALVAAGVLVLIGFTAVGLWQWKRRPSLLIGWLYFAGTLVPVIGLVQVGTQAFADRFTYIPMFGIVLAFVPLLNDLPAVTQKALLAVPLLLAAVTFHQIGYWKDSITLFTHTLSVTPASPKVRNNLGYALLLLNKPAESIPHLEEAVRLSPDYERARLNLGLAYWRLDRIDDALKQAQETIRLYPQSGEAHFRLGLLYIDQQQIEKAAPEFEQALKLSLRPDMEADAHANLGGVYAGRGQMAVAEQHFRAALQQKPDMAKAHYNLVLALIQQGKDSEAMQQLSWGLAMTHGDPQLQDLMKRLQAPRR